MSCDFGLLCGIFQSVPGGVTTLLLLFPIYFGTSEVHFFSTTSSYELGIYKPTSLVNSYDSWPGSTEIVGLLYTGEITHFAVFFGYQEFPNRRCIYGT